MGSFARYFSRDSKPRSSSSEHPGLDHTEKDALAICLVKVLCRESLKLCVMGECNLMQCLMNPFPPGPPEAVNALPLNLCCVCLRKLQWLTQIDLLDRYSRLPAVVSGWYVEETMWIWER